MKLCQFIFLFCDHLMRSNWTRGLFSLWFEGIQPTRVEKAQRGDLVALDYGTPGYKPQGPGPRRAGLQSLWGLQPLKIAPSGDQETWICGWHFTFKPWHSSSFYLIQFVFLWCSGSIWGPYIFWENELYVSLSWSSNLDLCFVSHFSPPSSLSLLSLSPSSSSF